MTRQRRISLRLTGVYVLIGAVVGYVIEGAGMAVGMAVLLGAVGVATVFLAPEVLPPTPAAVPRPAVGDSPTAVRRRRTEGFVVLFAGVPVVVACVLLALVVPAGPWRWVAIAVAGVYLAWLAHAFVLSALGGERIERIRTRRYERVVASLEADRRLYRELVDPEVEAAKGRRLLRWFLIVLAAQAVAGALVGLGLLLSALL